MRGLTILVNFQDVTSTVTRDDVDAMLNGDNYTRNGNICSAREYFRRVSSGKLDYQNVVVGPFQLSREREFYVNNLLIEEALQLAVASGIDLKQFDSRNQNIIDALNVLYAGQTQYRGELWPHNFNINLQFGAMHTDLYLLTSLGRTAADLRSARSATRTVTCCAAFPTCTTTANATAIRPRARASATTA